MNNTAQPSSFQRNGLAALTLGAIGVVYGDIGTSPLYTIKEVFAPATGVPQCGQKRRCMRFPLSAMHS